jgi:exodeoxyribonuclease V alpha subunit
MAGPQAKPPDREVLAGIVERVTFHNADPGFCVLRVKARGHRDLATVVGNAATISAAEWITGDWVNNRTHGQQFKACFLCPCTPSFPETIELYLASCIGKPYRDGRSNRRQRALFHHWTLQPIRRPNDGTAT